MHKNTTNFWPDIKKQNSIKCFNMASIANGSNNIASMWYDHYKSFLNSVPTCSEKDNVNSVISEVLIYVLHSNVYTWISSRLSH